MSNDTTSPKREQGNRPDGLDLSGNLIFPHPKFHASESDLPIKSKTDLPLHASSSESLLVLDLDLDPDETETSSSRDLLGASIGTLSSLAPSSMLTLPPSSSSVESSNVEPRRKDKQKQGDKKKPSGLSLSRPSSDTSSEEDGSSSRASSADSNFRSGRVRPSLVTNPTAQQEQQHQDPTMSPTPSPATATARSPIGVADEGNGIGSTLTVTPMGTPKATARTMLDNENESGAEGQHHDREHDRIDRSGHVRWKSPLRTERREVELPSGQGAADMDERTPLLDREAEAGYGYATMKADEESGFLSRFEMLHRVDSDTSNDDVPTKKPKKPFNFPWDPTPNPPTKLRVFMKKQLSLKHASQLAKVAFGAIPAVLLGCLLNVLDGVSCE